MKLLSIRLHPFGGTADRTVTLHDGLNVLEGPNEFGKSTLTHALSHALHTPTNLTPAKLDTKMGRWYPQPGGDHARLTLRFEADGRSWTLDKTWGAGEISRLQAEGVPVVADAGRVQERLAALLRLNEATWRNVLFTNQAELARTTDDLRKCASALDDVHGLLAGAAAIPGDIPADQILAGLGERIDMFFGRWDIQLNEPTGGRGLSDPWRKSTGRVVEAYYAQERVRSKLDAVVGHEEELDAVNGRIRSLAAQLAADAEFVQHGRTLRDGLSQRGAWEEKITRLTGEEKTLMFIVTAWPGADRVIKAREEEHARLGESLKRLDSEIDDARTRAAAEVLRNGHKRLTETQVEWESANRKLAAARPVDGVSIQELRQVEQRIAQRNIEIAAQKLAAKLESTGTRTVTLHRGSGAPKTIALGPGQPWEGEAAGRISVVGDLRVTVQSGMEDVDSLFAKLQAATARQGELLRALGHDRLADAEAAAKVHDELASDVKIKEGLITAALQGKSPEQWAADIATLDALPATRDLAVLYQERNAMLGQRAELKANTDQERQKAEQWTREYTDVPNLMKKVIAAKDELQQAQQNQAWLPTLPEGFTTVAAYLKDLNARNQVYDGLNAQLGVEQQERWRLEGATPEGAAEDLHAELELKECEFERQRSEGQALLRIREKLKAVIEQRGNADPLQGLREAVSRHFQALTARRYNSVQLEGTAPVEVDGAASLPTGLLSQGTLGSLAMATRLALAELYLRDDNGFIVLDDPFIDMDPARREAAARAVGAFAERRQVLFLTCHPLHRQELQEVAGAQVVEVG